MPRRPVRAIALEFALIVALASCGGRACQDGVERVIQRDVEVLTDEPGAAADAAEERLLARGAAAIPYLETGLYSAEPIARRRVVRVLVRLGDPAARPIYEHLARRDPDPDVRAAATAAIAGLASAPGVISP